MTAPSNDVIAEAEALVARLINSNIDYESGSLKVKNLLAHARQLEKDLAAYTEYMPQMQAAYDSLYRTVYPGAKFNHKDEHTTKLTEQFDRLRKERDSAIKERDELEGHLIDIGAEGCFPDGDGWDTYLTHVKWLREERDSLQAQLDGAVRAEVIKQRDHSTGCDVFALTHRDQKALDALEKKIVLILPVPTTEVKP